MKCIDLGAVEKETALSAGLLDADWLSHRAALKAAANFILSFPSPHCLHHALSSSSSLRVSSASLSKSSGILSRPKSDDMRLLNSTTLEFKVFNDDELPPYAILSHTWGQEEISYQDQKYLQKYLALSDNLWENEVYMVALEAAAGLDFKSMGRESMRARAGYSKLEMTARIAKAKDLEWFWVRASREGKCLERTLTCYLRREG
jgi:hypothetical protein